MLRGSQKLIHKDSEKWLMNIKFEGVNDSYKVSGLSKLKDGTSTESA